MAGGEKKKPDRSCCDDYYSVVKGNKAITLALLIAIVNAL